MPTAAIRGRSSRALYGGGFWREIANDPAKLGHPRLRYWRDATKDLLLSIAQRMRNEGPDTPSNMSLTELAGFNSPRAPFAASDAVSLDAGRREL
jgi:hypothetical protein